MSRLRWIVLAAVVVSLVCIQHFGLEAQSETKEESEYHRLSDLPPGQTVPTYIGMLFLGSFRAIAIDILWIKLKTAQEEHRWYAAREIAELISYLQPRNQEVWQMLSWDSTYNVSHNVPDREEQWRWIKSGIIQLAEGCRRNPRSVYLRSSLAMTLWHFPTRYHGFESDVLKRIENDEELQEKLQEERPVKNRKTSFELSLRWYDQALTLLKERYQQTGFDHETTQMGLNLYEDTLEGFKRDAMFLNAFYAWSLGTTPDSPYLDKAKDWFRRAAAHSAAIRPRYSMSIIFDKYEKLYAGLPDVIEHYRHWIASPGDDKAGLAFLRSAEELLAKAGPFDYDERYLYQHIVDLKRRLSTEHYKVGEETKTFVDENEYNDLPGYSTPLRLGSAVRANLKPWPGDIDVYVFVLNPPSAQEGEEEAPQPFHRRVTLQITDTKVPLSIRVQKQGPLATVVDMMKVKMPVPDTIVVDIKEPGQYFVEVRALDDSGPAPDDTRYGIEILRIEG